MRFPARETRLLAKKEGYCIVVFAGSNLLACFVACFLAAITTAETWAATVASSEKRISQRRELPYSSKAQAVVDGVPRNGANDPARGRLVILQDMLHLPC